MLSVEESVYGVVNFRAQRDWNLGWRGVQGLKPASLGLRTGSCQRKEALLYIISEYIKEEPGEPYLQRSSPFPGFAEICSIPSRHSVLVSWWPSKNGETGRKDRPASVPSYLLVRNSFWKYSEHIHVTQKLSGVRDEVICMRRITGRPTTSPTLARPSIGY